MDYKQGYVYDLMDAGGPTDVREPYFKEAVDEMMRARKLCAIANAKMPDDESYVADLEELFGRKLDDVRILTPFTCDFGNRVTFGKGVFINHSAILSASGGIEFDRHHQPRFLRTPHQIHLRQGDHQEKRVDRNGCYHLPRRNHRTICHRSRWCGRHQRCARLCGRWRLSCQGHQDAESRRTERVTIKQ